MKDEEEMKSIICKIISGGLIISSFLTMAACSKNTNTPTDTPIPTQEILNNTPSTEPTVSPTVAPTPPPLETDAPTEVPTEVPTVEPTPEITKEPFSIVGSWQVKGVTVDDIYYTLEELDTEKQTQFNILFIFDDFHVKYIRDGQVQDEVSYTKDSEYQYHSLDGMTYSVLEDNTSMIEVTMLDFNDIIHIERVVG